MFYISGKIKGKQMVDQPLHLGELAEILTPVLGRGYKPYVIWYEAFAGAYDGDKWEFISHHDDYNFRIEFKLSNNYDGRL